MADLTVPDLFDHPDYWRLYQLMLAKLWEKNRDEEVVIACDQIDALAAVRTSANTTPITFPLRVRALVDLGRYDEAIESAVRMEWKHEGIRRDCRSDPVTLKTFRLFSGYYGPLLYFSKEDIAAKRIFDECGIIQLKSESDSIHMLYWVYRGGETPECLPEVGLESVYARLNLTLLDWPQWPNFVAGFSESWLQDANVIREKLLLDPELLLPIREAFRGSRKRSPEEIEERRQFSADLEKRKPELDRQLSELFPFLKD